MPASIETLKMMTTDHAINALRADFDPLTGTELEAFLIDRLEALADVMNPELDKAMDDYDITPAEVGDLCESVINDVPNTVALLNALTEASVDTPALLVEKLKRADDFYNLATDGEEVFTRLANLAKSTV